MKRYLLSITAILLLLPSQSVANDNALILPPELDYKATCKPIKSIANKRYVQESLLDKPLPGMTHEDLHALIGFYYVKNKAIAPDYSHAIKVIEHILALPANNQKTLNLHDKAFLLKATLKVNGLGYTKNTAEASEILYGLIRQNETIAYQRLGDIFSASERYKKAIEYYKKAILAGHRESYAKIALLYYKGHVKVTDEDIYSMVANAHNYAIEKIRQGDCSSVKSTASLYSVLAKLPNAVQYSYAWYAKAALLDDTDAKLRYANLIRSGLLKDVPQDYATQLIKEASDLGSPDAMYSMGADMVYSDESDAQQRGLQLLERAAELRSVKALELLPKLYKGSKTVEANIDKRIFWLEKLAETDNADVSRLEELVEYYQRYPDLIDKQKLFALYQRMAIMGSNKALLAIGDVYRNGVLGKREPTRALRYYRLAASEGNNDAIRRLLSAYRCEIGQVYKPEKEAYWDAQLEFFSHKATVVRVYDDLFNNNVESLEGYKKDLKRIIKVDSDPEAYIALGAIYYLEANPKAAEEQFALALEKDKEFDDGYKAHIALAELYLHSKVVPLNNSEAQRLLTLATEQDNDNAFLKLGKLYLQRGEQEAARDAFKRASKLGSISASRYLAKIYIDAGDINNAIGILKKSAHKYDVKSMLMLAQGYDQGGWAKRPDEQRVRKWLGRAYESYPCDTETITKIAHIYTDSDFPEVVDKNRALQLLDKVKLSDDPVAKLSYAKLIKLGDIVDEASPLQKEADDILSALGDAGNSKALKILASIHMHKFTSGQEADPKQALHWLKQSANAGDSDAMKQLGELYLSGYNVKYSSEQALYWFKKAEEKGDRSVSRIISKLQN